MKTFKLAIFSIAMALVLFTSCTNNESVIEDQQNTEESESITTALNQLSLQFDQNGNVTQTDNPAGNIVFDFCFDFVYPLDLSFNNGTTVSVDSLENLVDVILASNDILYVNGIAFPFDVETYNEDSNAIEIVTINDEVEFANLVEGCGFDDFETCDCFEVYEPVCVEVSDPNGDVFTITYSNACYAECDGFTENDFLDSCESDYNPGGGSECFSLNYPLDIIIDNETTITVNSDEELGNALYDAYNFDFVYPLDLTIVNGDTITIYNQEDFEAILTDCYGCICPTEFNPVCVEIELGNGEIEIITFSNACEAECLGFTQEDFVDCEDDNNPSYCTEAEIAAYLQECNWLADISLYDTQEAVYFSFDANYVYDVNPSTQETTQLGSWVTSTIPSTGSVIVEFNTSDPYSEISSYQWTVTECSEDYIIMEFGDQTITLVHNCN